MNTISEVEDFLSHYGVKGMRWGVRKTPGGPSSTGVYVKRGKIRGVELSRSRQNDSTPSEDAARAAINKAVVRTHSTDKLSNKELQDLVTRLNLEQQFDRLRPRSGTQKAVKFITDTLVGVGKEQATRAARDYIGETIKNANK